MMGVSDLVNVPMLKQPINWFIVGTVALFVSFAWTLIHEKVNNTPTADV